MTSSARLMLRPTTVILLKSPLIQIDVIAPLPSWRSKRAVTKAIICRLTRKKLPSMISRREWSYMANFLVSPSFVSVSFLSLVLGPSQLTTSFFFLPSRFYQWLQSFLSTVHRKSPVEAAKTAYSVYRLWKFDGFTGSVEQCALDLTKVSCLSTTVSS